MSTRLALSKYINYTPRQAINKMEEIQHLKEEYLGKKIRLWSFYLKETGT